MNKTIEEDAENNFSHLKWLVMLFVVIPIVALGIFLEFRIKTLEENFHYREPNARDDARMELDTLPWHPVQGQTLYVPAYSHVYHQAGKPYLLTVTLSARNTDRENEIVLTSVEYFDTSGKNVRSLLKKPLRLGPLASTDFVIDQQDKTGGSGASFIIQWQSGKPVTQPLLESIMIDTSNTQGISFVRPATVLDEVLLKN